MPGIFKIIIAMAIISLCAYGLHLLEGRRAKPPSGSTLIAPHLATEASPAKAATQAPSGDALIYPGPAARRALHLGYAVFEVRQDGSMMALPLPPGSAWQTLLALDPTDHRRLVLAPMGPDCGFAVVIAMYRADRAAPAWRGELPAHSPSSQQVVDLSAIGAEDPLVVSLKMADGANNNWSCNVILSWDDSGQVPS